jgi:plasmid maintenance system antidote protein VapI
MYHRDFYPALRELWEDAKLGSFPGTSTVNDWINDVRPWKLTHGQWQIVAKLLNLSNQELSILLSGRIGNRTYTWEEIERVMSKRLPITDPNFDLRYLIKSAGITQTAFAKAIDTPLRTVQDWIGGVTPHPSPDVAVEIYRELKCSPQEFAVACRNSCTAKLSAFREKKLEKIVA